MTTTPAQNTKPTPATANRSERPGGNQGNRRGGGRGGNRPQRPTDEFESVNIDIARVTRVMAGGKRMRFRACVIVGDKKGRIGMAIAKGADVSMAVNKAVTKAKKHIMVVPIINETIPHRAEMKFSGAQVMIKPAPKGTGVMAGGAMRSVLELAGVGNVVGKSLGSSNKLNCVKATLGALEQLKPISAIKKAAEKVGTVKASS